MRLLACTVIHCIIDNSYCTYCSILYSGPYRLQTEPSLIFSKSAANKFSCKTLQACICGLTVCLWNALLWMLRNTWELAVLESSYGTRITWKVVVWNPREWGGAWNPYYVRKITQLWLEDNLRNAMTLLIPVYLIISPGIVIWLSRIGRRITSGMFR